MINLRISKNVSYSEITKFAVPIIFNDMVKEIQTNPNQKGLGEILKEKIELWSPLFKKFNIGDVEVIEFFNAVNNFVFRSDEPS